MTEAYRKLSSPIALAGSTIKNRIANKKPVKARRKVSKAIHDQGATAILQLTHAGCVSDLRVLGGKAPVNASSTQSGGWTLYTDNDYERGIRSIKSKTWPKLTFGRARALTIMEIDKVAPGFADGGIADRKYVIRPPLDYGLAHPVALEDPKWTTKW